MNTMQIIIEYSDVEYKEISDYADEMDCSVMSLVAASALSVLGGKFNHDQFLALVSERERMIRRRYCQLGCEWALDDPARLRLLDAVGPAPKDQNHAVAQKKPLEIPECPEVKKRIHELIRKSQKSRK